MQKSSKRLIAKLLEYQVKRFLKRHHPKIIAITGSVGKTSTKLAIAQVLARKYKVLAHEGNYNSEIGLPLSIFDLEAPANLISANAWMEILRQTEKVIKAESYPYEVLVLEMGADSPGDIKRFMSYITPDIGIVTAIAKVHTEQFKNIEAIEKEKWHLALGSKQAIINAQDPRLKKLSTSLEVRPITYGVDGGDYTFNTTTFQSNKGIDGILAWEDFNREMLLPVASIQSIYPLVAAAAVGDLMGVPVNDISAALLNWKQPNGRMNLLNGKKGITVIDDTYNASPYATVAALAALDNFKGRKIAILGSMNELGDYEAEGHKLVGSRAGDLDYLITIGAAAAKYLVPAAMEAGMDEANIYTCQSPYEAGKQALQIIQAGDVVLAKGSQNGVFAEEAVKQLLNLKSDKKYLVRQGPKWQKIKKAQFDHA